MKTAIIYWSSTGNTEAMAQAVAQGVESVGAEAVLLTPDQVDPAALHPEVEPLGLKDGQKLT